MKKLLALFLACVLTSQLAVPAWAEEMSEDTEQNTEASVTVEEPETVIPQETQLPEEPQMPEEEPTEESQEPESQATEPPAEAETEPPTEAETEPTEEPVPEETEEEPSEPVEETNALTEEETVLLIKPTELESLTAGDSVTLTLWSTKEETEVSAKWTLAEGDEAYGSLTEDGELTAKDVQEKAQVTVTAEPATGETAVQKTVTICPKDTALLLTLDGETLGEALRIDLNDQEMLTLTAVTDLTGEAREVKWSSSKKTVAQVDENGVVTLSRAGTTVIQATTTDGTLTGKLTLIVVDTDRSPQLTERKLALNIAKETEVSVEFREDPRNSIEEVSLNDDRFEAEFQDDQLTIRLAEEAEETLKAGKYSLKLEAVCANGRTYTYGLTISVTNQLPSVSIRQIEKLNLFYRDSAAELSINVPGQVIERAELAETDDFCLEEDEDGRWLIRYADPDDVPASPDTKAVLNVYLEGYLRPVQKTFSIGTTTVRPTVRLSAASSTLNTYLSGDWTTKVKLLDKSGAPLDPEEMDISCSNAEVGTDGEFVTITLEEPKSTSVTLEIQDSNWTQPIRLTHRINVSTKKPTLKLTGSLSLNRVFPGRTALMEVTLSQNNLVLEDMEFTPTSREGTSAYDEAAKLDISYDPETGSIVASIANPEDAPRIGSYSFKYTAILDGDPISSGTLKVTVTSVAPRVRISPVTVKLNRYLAGEEQATATVSVAGDYRVVGFEGLPDGMSFDAETGTLSIRLSDESDCGGTYGLRPIIYDLETEEEVKLPTRVNFKVQTYYSEKIGVSLVSRGRLDTQKPESERTYTVKLTNCLGNVEDMTLEGPDGDMFDAELDDDGTVHLKLKADETYATNRAYRIRFRFAVFGKEVLTPIQRVTVSQTPLKVTAPRNITYRLSQEEPLKFELTATAPVEDVIMGNTTNAAFQEAFAGPFLEDNECSFYILDPDALKAGKSYSVALKVTPENNAENVNPVTVWVTVKVMK